MPSSSSSSSSSSLSTPLVQQPLGSPLPCDEHACSVSLPTWKDVVGYEEGDSTITKQLKCGYPRFVYHPYVLQLMELFLQKYSTPTITAAANVSVVLEGVNLDDRTVCYNEDCIVLPTKLAALRCQTFLQIALQEYKIHQVQDNALIGTIPTTTSNTNACSRIRVVEWKTTTSCTSSTNDAKNGDDTNDGTGSNDTDDDTIYAVFFPSTTMGGMQAKAYWQHTGEIVSSRRAERVLTNLQIPIQKYITTSKSAYHPAFVNDGTTVTDDSTSNTTTPVSTCDVLPNHHSSSSSFSPHDELRKNIAKWSGIDDPDYVFLTPSGMSSIYTALRTSRRYQLLAGGEFNPTTRGEEDGGGDGGTSIVFGFPYLDTLKLCSRPELSPGGVEFFGHGCKNDLDNLELLLQKSSSTKQQQQYQQYSALFTEVPSNPLLQCPDLIQLRKLADKYNFCLIVDDTISNFLNIDVLTTGIADAVCTSLTKLISGRGDVIAGSILCNPYTRKGRWMQNDLFHSSTTTSSTTSSNHTNKNNNNKSLGLHESDARAVLYNSYDFIERNQQINETAVQLAEWFHNSSSTTMENTCTTNGCPDVDQVYYPKVNTTSVQHYHTVMRPQSTGAGYGGLMSITLHRHMCQRHFYDALTIAKGPSLGTNFTLTCPYTLLAHYHELDFAMGYNVPPNLLRISVGLEPLEVIQDAFRKAFDASRLYPKPKCTTTTANTTTTIPTRTNNQTNQPSGNTVTSINKEQQQQPSLLQQHTTRAVEQQQQQRRSFTTTASCRANDQSTNPYATINNNIVVTNIQYVPCLIRNLYYNTPLRRLIFKR